MEKFVVSDLKNYKYYHVRNLLSKTRPELYFHNVDITNECRILPEF